MDTDRETTARISKYQQLGPVDRGPRLGIRTKKEIEGERRAIEALDGYQVDATPAHT